MTLRYGDRVQESVAAPSGSGAFTISTTAGWASGYQTFANIPGIVANDTVYYTATDTSGNVEIGIGTYASGSLTRTTVLTSSNGNAAVTFSGTVTLFCDVPAKVVGGVPPTPGLFQRSRFYSSGGTIQAANYMCAAHFELTGSATPQALACDFSGAPSPTFSVRMGIYQDSGGIPGALVPNSDTGTLSATAGGMLIGTLTGVGPLAPGNYWLAYVGTAASSADQNSLWFQTYENDAFGSVGVNSSNTRITGYVSSAAITFGALPTTFPAGALSTSNNIIAVYPQF